MARAGCRAGGGELSLLLAAWCQGQGSCQRVGMGGTLRASAPSCLCLFAEQPQERCGSSRRAWWVSLPSPCTLLPLLGHGWCRIIALPIAKDPLDAVKRIHRSVRVLRPFSFGSITPFLTPMRGEQYQNTFCPLFHLNSWSLCPSENNQTTFTRERKWSVCF